MSSVGEEHGENARLHSTFVEEEDVIDDSIADGHHTRDANAVDDTRAKQDLESWGQS
jgi:hypothetical protein